MRFRPRLPNRRKQRILLVAALAAPLVVWTGLWLWTQHQLGRARSALAARDVETALVYLRRAGPFASAERQFLLARAYRRQGRFPLVRQHLARAWKLGYPVEPLEREQWLAMAQAGQLRESEPYLATLLQNPGDDGPEICEAYVNGYFRVYRFHRAFALLDAWQADYPDDPQPHVFRGIYSQHQKHYPPAAQAFRDALRLAPERDDVRLRLAQTLLELHEYDEAEEHFRRCFEADPQDTEVRVGWGRCRMEQGRSAEARELFGSVLEAAPDHFDAVLGIGKLELAEQRPHEALQWLRRAVAQKPYELAARHALATALVAVGEAAAAREHFQFVADAGVEQGRIRDLMDRVLKDPANADLRYEIGAGVLKSGRDAEGVAWLQSALEVDGQHLPARTALADHFSRRGDDELADRYRTGTQGVAPSRAASVGGP